MTAPVLVVESEPAIHAVMRLVLERHGYVVEGAYTAAQADACVAAARPGAVLINMELPDADGLDLCRSIRAHEPEGGIPVLVLCGSCRRGDHDRARLAGADAFQTLPFDERAALDWLAAQMPPD